MDGLVLKEIVLNKERMTIGRRASNDIQIDNLAISGEHAAVVTILDDSFFEDLNSTNGTLVNGQPIKKHFLKNGDVVELGKYKLKYIADAAQSADAGYDKTMPPSEMLDPSSNQASDLPSSSSGEESLTQTVTDSPSVSITVLGALQVLNGVNAGREIDLTKTLTRVGKPGRQVAVVARRPLGYFITHVEGAKFPMVNGQMVDDQAHMLKDHDVIDIAGVKMEFFLKE
jgi:pSer/pThr/pTyr-binding forkhead associated (FHA) protein